MYTGEQRTSKKKGYRGTNTCSCSKIIGVVSGSYAMQYLETSMQQRLEKQTRGNQHKPTVRLGFDLPPPKTPASCTSTSV